MRVVKSEIISPYTLPVLPRTSSAISGFFFCGMMEEPVVNASLRCTKPNSQLDQRMISSEKRERCIIIIEISDSSSSEKSRSETPSIEFGQTEEKPSSSAS